MTTHIAIVYFSGYGHTARQAEAVQAGAASAQGTEARLLRISEAGELPEGANDVITAADAVVYGTPTYLGGPAWQFKKFVDGSSKLWYAQSWKDKIAAGFTNSASLNGDKFATIAYLWTFAQQHGQIWVGTGLHPANKKDSGPTDVNWAGGFGGALAISPADASPEEAPSSGDLDTARLLGTRVASIASRFRRD